MEIKKMENTQTRLTVEQVAHVKKDLLVTLNNKKESFWDKFFSHDTIPAGHNKMTYRKQILTDLTDADLTNLAEGVTPDPKKIKYASFEVAPVDFGRWTDYTDKSIRYNFDDVVQNCKTDLSLDAFQNVEYRKAKALLATKCTMSAKTTLLETTNAAKVILRKNHVEPLSGNMFGWILTPELENELLTNYMDKLTHTSESDCPIKGYIGRFNGFMCFSNDFYGLYGTNKMYSMFVGKANGKLPAKTLSFGSTNVQIIDKGLGAMPQINKDSDGAVTSVYNDALNQRGTIGYKLMGFATALEFEEAIIKCEHTYSTNPVIAGNAPTEANRTGYVAANL